VNVQKVKKILKFILEYEIILFVLGWLEPLLDPIARNPKASVVPVIEVIDDSTFEMHGSPIQSIQVGGFDWNLIFNWHQTPEREMKRREKKTDPIR
jgi:polypeptide N-acetylgalactosaminyltransferase